jgi:hypothetical protein
MLPRRKRGFRKKRGKREEGESVRLHKGNTVSI